MRGSGKERGHGTELAFCPKCGKDLFPGKHHVGCIAGKSAPRQAAKRQRQIMAQSTTTEDAVTLDTAGTTASLEAARRQASAKLASNDLSSSRQAASGSQCRAEARQLSQAELLFPSAMDCPIVVGGSAGQGKQLLLPPAVRAASAASIQAPGDAATAAAAKAGGGAAAAARQQAQVDALSELFLPHTELPTGSDLLLRAPSPAPLDGIGGVVDSAPRPVSPFGALLRPPSPPPLPPEWAGAPGGAPLFDFDQFDINKRWVCRNAVSPPPSFCHTCRC